MFPCSQAGPNPIFELHVVILHQSTFVPFGVLDSTCRFCFAQPQALAFGIRVEPPNRTPTVHHATSMRQSSYTHGCMSSYTYTFYIRFWALSSYTSSFFSRGCCRQPRLIPRISRIQIQPEPSGHLQKGPSRAPTAFVRWTDHHRSTGPPDVLATRRGPEEGAWSES